VGPTDAALLICIQNRTPAPGRTYGIAVAIKKAVVITWQCLVGWLTNTMAWTRGGGSAIAGRLQLSRGRGKLMITASRVTHGVAWSGSCWTRHLLLICNATPITACCNRPTRTQSLCQNSSSGRRLGLAVDSYIQGCVVSSIAICTLFRRHYLINVIRLIVHLSRAIAA